jgi:hypothetical protein
LAWCLDQPHVQPRVVFAHSAHAGQQGACAFAPGVAIGARRFTCDPLAEAVVQRRAAVQRDGGLQAHPRPLALHAREKPDVQFARRFGTRAAFHLDAGSPQTLSSLAGDERVGVFDGHHHASHPGIHQCVAAGWRAPMVRAGFERDDDGRAARVFAMCGGIVQGHHFSMRAARLLGVAAADHAAVGRDDHAADARIRFAQRDGICSQRECLAHQGIGVHGWCCTVLRST